MNFGVRFYSGRADIRKIWPNQAYKDRASKSAPATGQVQYNVPPLLAKLKPHNAEMYTMAKPDRLPENRGTGTSVNPIGEGKSKPIQIGNKLFVSLIEAKGKFKPGTEVSYEIYVLDNADEFTHGFLLLDHSERKKITLDENEFLSPSFALQKDDPKDLRVAFGSCRKLHAEVKDMTITLFEKMYVNGKTAKSSTLRPNALFLLGDQIYADDVSPFLFPSLHQLGRALIGPDILPKQSEFNFYTKQSKEIYIPMEKSDARQKLINDNSSFTSEDAKNHLATFGEYCGMYLLAFCESIPDFLTALTLQTAEKLLTSKGLPAVDSSNSKLPKNHPLKEVMFFAQRIGFLKSISAASNKFRRIAANTPTYMLLDDHEITDDFNITPEWENRVSSNELGRHIVANGLTAYWFFQGWGNDPAEEKSDPLKTTNILANTARARMLSEYKADDVALLSKLKSSRRWSFIAPTSPASIFFDTRMSRQTTEFISYGNVPVSETRTHENSPGKVDEIKIPHHSGATAHTAYVPHLISDGEYDRLLKRLISKNLIANEIIICTPSPVFGNAATEYFKKKVVEADIKSFMTAEQEDWSYNPYGLISFTKFLRDLAILANNKLAVRLLSGDVHYSFNQTTTLRYKVTDDVVIDIKIENYTSSGIKNPADPRWAAELTGNIFTYSNVVKNALFPTEYYFSKAENELLVKTDCELALSKAKHEPKMKWFLEITNSQNSFPDVQTLADFPKFVDTKGSFGFIDTAKMNRQGFLTN